MPETMMPGTIVEIDPNGIPAGQPGSKLDKGKSPVFSGLLDYFPRAVMAVADLSAYGAHKYTWKGWEKVPDGEKRYANALVRHITKESIEGIWDLDARNDPNFPADILHATQQAWNALARLELMLRRITSIASPGLTVKTVSEAYREQCDPTAININGRKV